MSRISMSRISVTLRRTAFGLMLLSPVATCAAAPPRVTVEIKDFMFEPKTITVAPGTEVVWVNRDADPHTVVNAADSKAMMSPVLDTSDTFAFVFQSAGDFAYFCSVHPHMQGKVIVK